MLDKLLTRLRALLRKSEMERELDQAFTESGQTFRQVHSASEPQALLILKVDELLLLTFYMSGSMLSYRIPAGEPAGK